MVFQVTFINKKTVPTKTAVEATSTSLKNDIETLCSSKKADGSAYNKVLHTLLDALKNSSRADMQEVPKRARLAYWTIANFARTEKPDEYIANITTGGAVSDNRIRFRVNGDNTFTALALTEMDFQGGAVNRKK